MKNDSSISHYFVKFFPIVMYYPILVEWPLLFGREKHKLLLRRRREATVNGEPLSWKNQNQVRQIVGKAERMTIGIGLDFMVRVSRGVK